MKALQIVREPFVTYQIVPDRTARNWNVDILTRAVADMHEFVTKRVKLGKGQLTYEEQETVGFDMIIQPGNVTFHITVPKRRWAMLHQKLEAVWPKATYKQSEIPLLSQDNIRCCEMSLRKHNIYALKTAKNDNDPLNSLLQAVKDIREDDIARVSTVAKPINRAFWEYSALAAYEKHRQGIELHRFELTASSLFRATLRGVDSLFTGLHGTASETMGGKKSTRNNPHTLKSLNRRRELSNATLAKLSEPVFVVSIRIAVQSDDRLRAETIIRSLANSFKDLTGDNELIRHDVGPKQVPGFLSDMESYSMGVIGTNKSVLCVSELSKLWQIPGAELQEQFPEIDQILRRETNLPVVLLHGGIPMGRVKFKGAEHTVHWPINDRDELCLSRVMIGKQGSGKTTAASNFAIGCIEQGFSVFVHDVADGKLCDDVRDGLPKGFPADHIVELDFGDLNNPIGVDWYDSARRASGNTANRISSELALFLERFTDDTGGRTRRWLKKAAQSVYSLPDSSLLDVILMLCSPKFRKKIYPRLTDRLVVQAWKTFDKMSEAAQNQIVQPVLNRIDYLLDDEALKNVLCQEPNLDMDFRKWADGDNHPYCVLLRVPKAVLGATATDALMTFLNTKLWMAILTRQDIPITNRRPASVFMTSHTNFRELPPGPGSNSLKGENGGLGRCGASITGSSLIGN